MSFSKGLTITRSERGYVEAKHSCGLSTVRRVDRAWVDNPKISEAAWNKEMDRLEKAAVEALKNIYQHTFRPKR